VSEPPLKTSELSSEITHYSAFPALRLPRLIAVLGGTTTIEDCLIALRHLVDPRHLIQGPAIMAYEEAFAKRIGVRFGISFSCARVGLHGLLRTLGVGAGDDVLLQVPTHVSIPNAIRYAGARPLYVDCRLENYNIDLEQAAHRVTPRSKVLLLQHTFGIPVDLDAAREFAGRHSLEVIEDCVHALGSTYRGKPLGSHGRAAIFSTEETKTISTTMGGMVVTDDPEIAAQMRKFQQACPLPLRFLTAQYLLKLILYHVMTEPHFHPVPRMFYELLGRKRLLPEAITDAEAKGLRPQRYEQRLSNAQAALGLSQLKYLGENIRHRTSLAQTYGALLPGLGYRLPTPPANAQPLYVRFPICVADRDATIRAVRPKAIMGTWFSSVLEGAASTSLIGYERGSCPNAEMLASHLINLPTHPRVNRSDAEGIVAILAASRPVSAPPVTRTAK